MQMLAQPWERFGVAIGRIAIGYMWFTQLQWKMPPTFGCPPDFAVSVCLQQRTTGLCDWTGLMAQYSLIPWHGALIQSLVVPNLAWMGWLIWLAEAFAFVSLTFGLLSRLGALVGLMQAANLYIGLTALPLEWYWTYGFMVVLHWLFLCIAPGRTFGVDQLLISSLHSTASEGKWWARTLLLAM